MGIAEILFVIFLVLKLVGAITWSWWWVCAPLWIVYGLLALFVVIMSCIGVKVFGRGQRRRF